MPLSFECRAGVLLVEDMALLALAMGMPASSSIFSGVGKSRRELSVALDAGIGQFNLAPEEAL